ncbi:SPFH domain-containing protein [Streptomyces sp. SP18ES09]|uniref:SPFH domain-containing protein n=1 Tax=Streptomyces sp. SP18ES09 TaxID=3002532 RepID=UPI002E787096|nr:SPFH domain-containing protein [Streptomyces sp. SP18ES09]MEE1814805.1 SPFH domain-containing protein [Streptomyces sp. SP18ES09]
MTASTPNPADSGAAASRDAARTARRLTDGTLPRTSPPDPDQLRERTPAPAPEPGPPAGPEGARTAPVSAGPGLVAAGSASAAAPVRPTGPGAVVPEAGAPGALPARPAAGVPEPARAPGGEGPGGGTADGAVEAVEKPAAETAGRPTATAVTEAAVTATAVTETAVTETVGRAAATAATAVAGAPDGTTDASADGAAEALGGTGGVGGGKASGVGLAKADAPSVARTSAPSVAKADAPSVAKADAPSIATSDTPGIAKADAPKLAPSDTPSLAKAATPELPKAGAVASGRPPAEATSAPTAPASASAAPALDFERVKGARVGAVALPVAAVTRVARRRNVIGAETTGSIPVHLLFRDEPETAVPVAGSDDGGPDTISMDAPTPSRTGRRPAIPAPSKVQAPVKPEPGPRPGAAPERRSKDRPESRSASRPAPTADPDLVERAAPVLPGWMGVVGGALAVAGCAAVVWWAGAVPAEAARMLRLPTRPYHGVHLGQWALLALGVVLALFSLGGLGRGRVGYAWVLTLYGDYRGTVRRTGLLWVSPLLLRRRVDVRLRHWRSEPLSAVDAKGTALDVTVLVVWRVRDTVRAALGVDGHEDYLREQVEAAMARVLSQLPADAFHEDAPTLRDAEAVGEALTRMLSAECAPVGVDVFSAQPTRIEYAPEVAAAMRRRRIAAIDAKHRDSVLTSVVDAVDDVVHRLTSRGLVELDDYERKALVKDLTVAFYTGRTGPVEGA